MYISDMVYHPLRKKKKKKKKGPRFKPDRSKSLPLFCLGPIDESTGSQAAFTRWLSEVSMFSTTKQKPTR